MPSSYWPRDLAACRQSQISTSYIKYYSAFPLPVSRALPTAKHVRDVTMKQPKHDTRPVDQELLDRSSTSIERAPTQSANSFTQDKHMLGLLAAMCASSVAMKYVKRSCWSSMLMASTRLRNVDTFVIRAWTTRLPVRLQSPSICYGPC